MAQESYDTALERSSAISRRGTVLLVDEDRADLRRFGSILGSFGCLVQRCESYQEGARLLDSDAFDLIVVGQGSPKFEGRCVLERAHQIDRHPRVLVLARCPDMPCYLEAMQLGAVDYLAEPVSVQELGRVADAHLRLAPRLAGAEPSRRLSRGSGPV